MKKRIQRILFIEPKSPNYHVFSRYKIPRLGLPQLGTILKNNGYDVKIIFQELEPRKKIDYRKIRKYKPDLVGVSSITSTVNEAYIIADKIKDLLKIPVVFGGAHSSFMAEESLMHCDYVIRKEGDVSFLQLIESLSENKSLKSVLGLSFKNKHGFSHNPDAPPICDLNSLPDPDLTLIDSYEKLNMIPIDTSRGCPYSCKFCSVIKMFGRNYRYKSPQKVIENMKKYPGKSLFFVDDNFAANKSRAKELLRLMIKEKVNNNWSAQVRTDIANDKELLSLMRKTNCTHLHIGFESINPESLKECNKKQTVEDIKKAIRIIHWYDINIHGMFMFGFDSDTKDTIAETVIFAKKTKIDSVQFLILTPLPGTETYYKLDKDNRIFYKGWKSYDGHHALFTPKNITAYELQVETMKAMNKFYSLFNTLKPVVSLDFIMGALAFALRKVETYLYKEFNDSKYIRDIITFFPAIFSKYISKIKFNNAVVRTIGLVITRKNEKASRNYIKNIILKTKHIRQH